jgi:hypothetical protein
VTVATGWRTRRYATVKHAPLARPLRLRLVLWGDDPTWNVEVLDAAGRPFGPPIHFWRAGSVEALMDALRPHLAVVLERPEEGEALRRSLGSVSEEIPRPKQADLSRLRNPFD